MQALNLEVLQKQQTGTNDRLSLSSQKETGKSSVSFASLLQKSSQYRNDRVSDNRKTAVKTDKTPAESNQKSYSVEKTQEKEQVRTSVNDKASVKSTREDKVNREDRKTDKLSSEDDVTQSFGEKTTAEETTDKAQDFLSDNSFLLSTVLNQNSVNTGSAQNMAQNFTDSAAAASMAEDVNGVNLSAETSESISISEQQMSYLKTTESPEDIYSMIDNAEEYVSTKTEEQLLSDAQNLSVNDPEAFLASIEQQGDEIPSEESLKTLNLKDSKNKNLSSALENGKEILSGDNESDLSADDSFSLIQGRNLKSASENKGVFTVTDLRTSTNSDKENGESDDDKNGRLILDMSQSQNKDNSVDVTMSLSKNVQQNILSSNDQTAAASSSNFQQMLSHQIVENAPEFVKAGNIVLKDNNSGTINMVLKPESLGNVKITLEVSDKVITGQITVHSREAYEAFKESIASLKQAFEQNGYENASFNLNLAENSNNSAFAQSQNQGQQGSRQLFGERTYDSYASTGAVEVSERDKSAAYTRSGDYQIDVVA